MVDAEDADGLVVAVLDGGRQPFWRSPTTIATVLALTSPTTAVIVALIVVSVGAPLLGPGRQAAAGATGS